jgi:hypothetical protein
MAAEGRVRISLATGELEIEGTSEFVKQYDDAISDMLDRLASQPFSPPSGTGQNDRTAGAGNGDETDRLDATQTVAVSSGLELGEALHALPKNSTGTDKILVGAWYAQKSNSENDFTTLSANKLLIEQGIKLTNAAQCIKQNVGAKRVFKIRGNRWRISQSGVEHLASLGIS